MFSELLNGLANYILTISKTRKNVFLIKDFRMSNNDIYLNKKTVNIGQSIKVINYYKNDNVIGKCLSDGFFPDASKIKIIEENRIKNKNLLDIGAFIGSTSLLMAELVLNEDSVVYAFEPVYFECLEKNIKE